MKFSLLASTIVVIKLTILNSLCHVTIVDQGRTGTLLFGAKHPHRNQRTFVRDSEGLPFTHFHSPWVFPMRAKVHAAFCCEGIHYPFAFMVPAALESQSSRAPECG